MDTINIRSDKDLLRNWVAEKQQDPKIKCIKMNSSTASHITEVVDCVVYSDEFKEKNGYMAQLVGIPIYIDKNLDDFIIKASEEEKIK